MYLLIPSTGSAADQRNGQRNSIICTLFFILLICLCAIGTETEATGGFCDGCLNGGRLLMPNNIFGYCRCRCAGDFKGPRCQFLKKRSSYKDDSDPIRNFGSEKRSLSVDYSPVEDRNPTGERSWIYEIKSKFRDAPSQLWKIENGKVQMLKFNTLGRNFGKDEVDDELRGRAGKYHIVDDIGLSLLPSKAST
jgi:hypothetical protein